LGLKEAKAQVLRPYLEPDAQWWNHVTSTSPCHDTHFHHDAKNTLPVGRKILVLVLGLGIIIDFPFVRYIRKYSFWRLYYSVGRWQCHQSETHPTDTRGHKKAVGM